MYKFLRFLKSPEKLILSIAVSLAVITAVIKFPKETTTTQVPTDTQSIQPSSTKTNLDLRADIEKMRASLSVTQETSYYKITPIPSPELVKNHKGNYFYIDILSSFNKRISFEKGEYMIDVMSIEFSNALGEFNKHYAEKAHHGGGKVWVRGMADILPIKSPKRFDPPRCANNQDFRSIEYYPSNGTASSPYRYSDNKLVTYFQRDTYSNNDLPLLRARFVQCAFQTISPAEANIIQGAVDNTENEESRSAMLIFYIPAELKIDDGPQIGVQNESKDSRPTN